MRHVSEAVYPFSKENWLTSVFFYIKNEITVVFEIVQYKLLFIEILLTSSRNVGS